MQKEIVRILMRMIPRLPDPSAGNLGQSSRRQTGQKCLQRQFCESKRTSPLWCYVLSFLTSCLEMATEYLPTTMTTTSFCRILKMRDHLLSIPRKMLTNLCDNDHEAGQGLSLPHHLFPPITWH